jgi:hypothetical protein
MSERIPYLEKLETDLTRAAAAAAETRGGARRRRPASGAWLRWSGAAAAILVLAWGVGSVASRDGGIFPASGDATSAAAGPADGGRDRDVAEAPSASPAPDAFGVVGNSVGGLQDRAWAAGGSDALGSEQQSGGGNQAPQTTTAARIDLAKIDRDGSLTLKIGEGSLGDTFIAVIDIAEGTGGMLLSSETVGDGAAHLTLRIPANRFDRAFAQVSQLGEVRASSITGKDVTADYIDYAAQLEILERRRAVILDLYDQVSGIPQTLQLESEYNRVQLEIDRIQGQLNYLDAQTSISTLRVSLSETEPEVEQLAEGDDRPSLGNAVDSGLNGFLGVVSAMIVGLGYLIPVAIVLALAFAVVMLVRRRDRGAS